MCVILSITVHLGSITSIILGLYKFTNPEVNTRRTKTAEVESIPNTYQVLTRPFDIVYVIDETTSE